MSPKPDELIPAELLPDFWNQNPSDNMINLTCLLPNGIVVPLDVNQNATLAEIKEDLWEEAAKLPLFGKLHDMSVYIFTYVNSLAEREKVNDESRRLCDIRPTGAILIVTECCGSREDDMENFSIGHLIGKRLQEFDSLNNAEVNDFRFKMRRLGDEIAQLRTKASWFERLNYQFPPRLAKGSHIYNETLKEKKKINVTSKFDHEYTFFENRNENEIMQSSFTFNIPPTTLPKELLEMILYKRATIMNKRNEFPNEYILKICGQDEFLYGDFELIEFQYIQDCLSREIMPTLITLHVNKVPVYQSNYYECLDILDTPIRTTSYSSTNTLSRKKKNSISSWDIEEYYSVKVCTISKLNCDPKKSSEIGIQAGIFHGDKSLCQPKKASDYPMDEKCECRVNNELIFDINVCNIPRNAKLCFIVYEVNKFAKGTKTKKTKDIGKESMLHNPIAWANTSIYDFKNQLKSGAMTLFMWTYAEDLNSDDFLHPLGTVVNNPNTEYCTTVTLHIKSYAKEQNIFYPTVEVMILYARESEKEEKSDEEKLNLEYCGKLLAEGDNLDEAHEQDRKNIWALKDVWRREQPEVLPKLLHCIDWDKRQEVSQAVALLQDWPKLPVEKSLELLDYAFPDREVRKFAVECLFNASDEDLLLYLLQLVQAIKHELFLDCDLVNFLLTRALSNQKIGHYLFWHLRSEMQIPAVSLRFGLILEAYCRGTQEHMSILQKQLDCVERLIKCSEIVRQRKDKEKAKAALREFLKESSKEMVLNHMRNPLDASYRCTNINNLF